MIEASVLVLNRNFQAIHITSVRRAFCLLAKGCVKVIDRDYCTYTLTEWMEFDGGDESVSTPRQRIAAPRVVVLSEFDKLPRREVKFSRRNVYLRDDCTCGYCGKRFPMAQLNLDHVIPVSRGGKSEWNNVTASCIKCNAKKDNRTPKEAGMQLIRKPQRPRWVSFMGVLAKGGSHPSWQPFMPHVALAESR